MISSTKMLFGIGVSLMLILLNCGESSGDPTLFLNAPVSSIGGLPNLGGIAHSPFLFDRDDDFFFGPAGYNAPIIPPPMPIAGPRPQSMFVVDRSQTRRGGMNIVNNELPIPGVTYVVPNRRSSSRRLYRRRNSFRRRIGFYG